MTQPPQQLQMRGPRQMVAPGLQQPAQAQAQAQQQGACLGLCEDRGAAIGRAETAARTWSPWHAEGGMADCAVSSRWMDYLCVPCTFGTRRRLPQSGLAHDLRVALHQLLQLPEVHHPVAVPLVVRLLEDVAEVGVHLPYHEVLQ